MKLSKLLIAFLLLGNCSTQNEIKDFGTEKGYFIYDLNQNKIPWERNRNYVSIEFYDWVEQDTILSILSNNELDFEDQVFPVKHILARCTSNPAEHYYTNQTLNSSLGNRKEVKYVLPVFFNEVNQRVLLTDRLRIEFKNLSKEMEEVKIDSLIQVDGLELLVNTEESGETYFLRVDKRLNYNSLQLSNTYTFLNNVKFSIPDYAFEIN